jgi:hypothetical protein
MTEGLEGLQNSTLRSELNDLDDGITLGEVGGTVRPLDATNKRGITVRTTQIVPEMVKSINVSIKGAGDSSSDEEDTAQITMARNDKLRNVHSLEMLTDPEFSSYKNVLSIGHENIKKQYGV